MLKTTIQFSQVVSLSLPFLSTKELVLLSQTNKTVKVYLEKSLKQYLHIHSEYFFQGKVSPLVELHLWRSHSALITSLNQVGLLGVASSFTKNLKELQAYMPQKEK